MNSTVNQQRSGAKVVGLTDRVETLDAHPSQPEPLSVPRIVEKK